MNGTEEYTVEFRSRESSGNDWGEWAPLQERLIYSHVYSPRFFEFRKVARIQTVVAWNQ